LVIVLLFGDDMKEYENLLTNALKLKPVDRAHLIEGLMASLEKPDPEIELLWEKEALDRYDVYKKGNIKAKNVNESLSKYEK